MKFLLLLIVRIGIFISNKGSEKGSDLNDIYCDVLNSRKRKTLEMNRIPKVRHKKSNIGVFIMKLRYKAKVQIYELRQQGISLKRLSEKYGINLSNLLYFKNLLELFSLRVCRVITNYFLNASYSFL